MYLIEGVYVKRFDKNIYKFVGRVWKGCRDVVDVSYFLLFPYPAILIMASFQ